MSKERFAMVSMAMISDTRLSCRQFKILCALKMFADSKTGLAHPKKEQISEATRIAKNKISEETRALVDLGWIEKTGNGGFSSSAIYTIFDKPKTGPETGLIDQPQKRASSKKSTSPRLGIYQPQTGVTTSPKLGQNEPHIGAPQVTDQQQTNNRPITDHITEPEKSTPKTRAKNPSVPAKAGTDKNDPLVTEFQFVCRQTWNAYATAYQTRYGIDPVRNAKVSAQVVQFCKRIPREDAPHVAAHFVRSNSSFYVSKGHQFGNLLADAEKLRTEWATGRSMTAATARQIDGTQTNLNAVDQALTMMQQRKQA